MPAVFSTSSCCAPQTHAPLSAFYSVPRHTRTSADFSYYRQMTIVRLFHRQSESHYPSATVWLHFMARRIADLGHDAKLISPQFVRPFVKSNKNDFIDAEAICEAASRLSMRFVQPRTEAQQAMRALHRVRESLVWDKVKTTNQMQTFLLEFGISMTRGIAVITRLSNVLAEHRFPLIWCRYYCGYRHINTIWLGRSPRLKLL
ncbi:hypothetical protein XCR1_1980005 [Xenorhabdus cabanillasii JM26]|uniref:Transposase IS110-like N-terminal domain-containing protein n=1 Tax=Xenorhabdus cabanillasii JM26 TaxID=1427517 RepID=W1J548_9GAMM|nr:transposase [Xenorhabdus cabanillasii JM26]CDL84575.1 hypothetical protein XCR1_1980005 [Xenorhabdus cabanillasii JM26]